MFRAIRNWSIFIRGFFCVFISVFLITLAGFTSFSEGSCLGNFLQKITMTPASARRELLNEIKDYHQIIRSRFHIENLPTLEKDFSDALQNIQKMSPSFPNEDFLAWYKLHPYPESELEVLEKRRATIGDLLKHKASEFEKTIPPFDLLQVESELDRVVFDLSAQCRRSFKCTVDRLTIWAREKLKSSCLAKHPIAVRNMISNVAYYTTALALSYNFTKRDSEKKNGFPYELILNQAFMAPFFGNEACQQRFGKGALPGDEIDTKTPVLTFKEKAQKAGRKWWRFYRWSALEEASYMSMHIMVQKAKGLDVDTDPEHLLKQYGSLMLYDGLVAAPRNAFILNPLFMGKNGFPLYRKWLKTKIPDPIFRETTYNVSEGATRLLTEGGKQFMFRGFNSGLDAFLKK